MLKWNKIFFEVNFCFKLYFTKLSNVWKSGTKFQIQIVILGVYLLDFFSGLSHTLSQNGQIQQKWRRPSWPFGPHFHFCLEAFFFFYGVEQQWTSRHDLAYFCFFSRMQPNKGEALADLGAAEELLHWRSLRDDCSLENIRFMTSL